MCASFFTLMTAALPLNGTHMSRDSIYEQFLCRVWVTRIPLWALLATSTYGILITAFDRYVAVVYPVWYNVRILKKTFPTSNADTVRRSSHSL